MERIYPRLSQRNIEEEVLSELEKISHNSHEDASAPNMPSEEFITSSAPKEQITPAELVKDYKTKTSYSRDFGTFDITICNGDDGTRIVLVLLEERVALNGKPVRFLRDGHVADWCGDQDPLLQRYYDLAMKVRAERGTNNEPNEVAENSGETKFDYREVIDTFGKFKKTTQAITNAVNLQAATINQKQRLKKSRFHLSCLFRRSRKVTSKTKDYDSQTSAATLSSLISDLLSWELKLVENFNSLLKWMKKLEGDGKALTWTVTSFCREAILRESDKFVHERYVDLYDKYVQAAGREAKLKDELDSERERNKSLQSDMEEMKSDLDSCEHDKIQETDPENQNDNSNHAKRLTTKHERLKNEYRKLKFMLSKFSKRKQNDSSKIAKMLVALKEQRAIINGMKRDANAAILIRCNLQRANRKSRTQIQSLKDQQVELRQAEESMKQERDKLSKETACLSEVLRDYQISLSDQSEDQTQLKETVQMLQMQNVHLIDEVKRLQSIDAIRSDQTEHKTCLISG